MIRENRTQLIESRTQLHPKIWQNDRNWAHQFCISNSAVSQFKLRCGQPRQLPLLGLTPLWTDGAALLLHAAGHDPADGEREGSEHEESCDGPRDCIYRGVNKGLHVLLSRTQAGPGRKVKQEQEEFSRNHVQTFIYLSVYCICSSVSSLSKCCLRFQYMP